MPLFVKVRSFLRNLFLSGRVEVDLDQEVQSHLEMLTEENLGSGMSPQEAQRAARIELGGIEQLKDQVREEGIGDWVHSVISDCRYGLRQLRKNPGFTAVAVLTLALGIGATTAIFGVVYGVLLRPLPFPRADQIVLIYEVMPGFGLNMPFNAPDFRAFSERQRAFASLAIYSNQHYEISGGAASERVEAVRSSNALFPLLGIQPILGLCP